MAAGYFYKYLKLIKNINLRPFQPERYFFDFLPAMRYKFIEHLSIQGAAAGSREDKNGSSGH
jgi:hypothetical protein